MAGVPFPRPRSKTNEEAKHVESACRGRLDGGSIPPGSTSCSGHRMRGGRARSGVTKVLAGAQWADAAGRMVQRSNRYLRSTP